MKKSVSKTHCTSKRVIYFNNCDFVDGPAVEAGLREEDIIERLNGKDVTSFSADVVAATIRY